MTKINPSMAGIINLILDIFTSGPRPLRRRVKPAISFGLKKSKMEWGPVCNATRTPQGDFADGPHNICVFQGLRAIGRSPHPRGNLSLHRLVGGHFHRPFARRLVHARLDGTLYLGLAGGFGRCVGWFCHPHFHLAFVPRRGHRHRRIDAGPGGRGG